MDGQRELLHDNKGNKKAQFSKIHKKVLKGKYTILLKFSQTQ